MMKDVLKQITDSKRLYGFVFQGAYFNVGTPERNGEMYLGYEDKPAVRKLLKLA